MNLILLHNVLWYNNCCFTKLMRTVNKHGELVVVGKGREPIQRLTSEHQSKQSEISPSTPIRVKDTIRIKMEFIESEGEEIAINTTLILFKWLL